MLGIKVEISSTPGQKRKIYRQHNNADVETAARESGKTKWQDMCEKSEKDRTLVQYRPEVAYKLSTNLKPEKEKPLCHSCGQDMSV